MVSCIFCGIVSKDITGDIIYEDDKVIAFNDTNPQAPIHFLIIPKQHIESSNEIDSENSHIISHIFEVIGKLTRDLGIDEDGYRIVNNCGKIGGQTVDHIHFHVLGGRKLNWPPG